MYHQATQQYLTPIRVFKHADTLKGDFRTMRKLAVDIVAVRNEMRGSRTTFQIHIPGK